MKQVLGWYSDSMTIAASFPQREPQKNPFGKILIGVSGWTTVNQKAQIHYIIPINDMVHRPL